ncbi:hypothetical protein HJC99_03500 [Candidatus Saccharibacteria bacterium]|nr:hypothetical protein [Candidatus Saccharibacteria bacterium]
MKTNARPPIGEATFVDRDGNTVYQAAGDLGPDERGNWRTNWRHNELPINARHRRRVRARIDWPELCRWLEIPIARRGATRSRFYAECIFHDEKSPSMSLTVDGRFTCFGCTQSGDMVDLVGLVFRSSSASDIRARLHAGIFPLMQQPSSEAARAKDRAYAQYLDALKRQDRAAMASYARWRYPDDHSVPTLKYVRGR